MADLFGKIKGSIDKSVATVSVKSNEFVETTKFKTQIATLEKEIEELQKTVGKGYHRKWLNQESDFEEIIVYLIDNLGFEKVKNIHIHFSKIMYGEKGEIKHLTFEDNEYGPNFEPLAKVLKKYNIEPVIICESKGTQAEDAGEMKQIFENLQNNN